MTDLTELKRLAEAATPGDLDSVPNPPTEYGGRSEGMFECPYCGGEGEVEGAAYTNLDGVALGVQFFGIGREHQAYEAFFRAAAPATVLSLIAQIEHLTAEREKDREALRGLVSICEEHDASVAAVIGRPVGWTDDYLNAARARLEDTHD